MNDGAAEAGRVLADRIAEALAPLGMMPFGLFRIEADDVQDAGHSHLAGSNAVLIGNAGTAMWEAFSGSPEFADGIENPLDRWTRRTVSERMAEIDKSGNEPVCLFPFGTPLWPFQRWAKRAMGVDASPLGLLIHPRYGLWFALRAALVVGEIHLEKLIQDVEKVIHPCDGCVNKPCLSACPVDAFSAEGFAVGKCRSYLDSTPTRTGMGMPDCMASGCAARNACPVGPQWRYTDAQLRFHMLAFGG